LSREGQGEEAKEDIEGAAIVMPGVGFSLE